MPLRCRKRITLSQDIGDHIFASRVNQPKRYTDTHTRYVVQVYDPDRNKENQVAKKNKFSKVNPDQEKQESVNTPKAYPPHRSTMSPNESLQRSHWKRGYGGEGAKEMKRVVYIHLVVRLDQNKKGSDESKGMYKKTREEEGRLPKSVHGSVY